MKTLELNNIKMVIWDLDDTFWKGTLSEESIEYNYRNIELVKKLTDRGIMNTIVSKNEYETAKDKLEEAGVFEYFVFSKISWNPKGEIVRNLLHECSLRAQNVLFIDDNLSNLEEVKFFNPDINAVHPDFLVRNDILKMRGFIGKDDKNHTRLQQYKNLEKRRVHSGVYSSNVEFLKNSQIVITCGADCLQYEDRLFELVHRTNQLNFTKVRIEREEFHELLIDNEFQSYYVKAKDNFGDYGLIGFYMVEDYQLKHFLFSCRVLGLGIEKYIYNKLGRPNIEIKQEVAVDLLDKIDKVDWITESEELLKVDKKQAKKERKLLMIGGCDLEQAAFYLDTSYEIKREFATQKEGRNYKASDSIQLVNALLLEESLKEELLTNLPFYHKDITFQTDIFKGEHDIIIWSVVDDYIRGIYNHNTLDCCISCGGYFDQEEYLARFTEADLQYLKDNFTYLGRETTFQFEKNIRTIIANIDKDASLILINGAEIDVSSWIGRDRCQRQIEMNDIVDKVVAEFQNVHLVDMRDIVKDKSELTKQDNRHFNRTVYNAMATNIVKIIQRINVDTKVKVITKRKELEYNAIAKCKSLYKKIKNLF